MFYAYLKIYGKLLFNINERIADSKLEKMFIKYAYCKINL